ncbi:MULTISPECIES: archaemetzincin family Zn-dependent metalloprotease [Ignavibacterium]|jgi:archaemetzincin|uniref:archaemetzincin family Zn-dependent metalloprotease n=1 Tax=Ignavibacterium TaxID=795750 RepID=UPI0025BCB3B8|nr:MULTISPECIES: archaemetzincin family Zn-dependent metalloprotease [Ignavibacterium]MBI5661171.1 archaemetzincin family Zn-dependent metalloprotease [Ignavibacterium album]
MQEIVLAPINFSNPELIDKIVTELGKFLPYKIRLNTLQLDISFAYSNERKQFYSTKIIQHLIPYSENVDGKFTALVEVDLFIPVFTYVLGEAQLNGKVSIVSLARLHEEIYSGISDEKLLIERTVKEILHELGHNFGLIHCKDWDCVMHSSMGIEEVDIKGIDYCANCKSMIQP